MNKKECEIFLRIFWYIWKVCRIIPTYPNLQAKIKKMISDIQFPGNRFELGTIKNYFWSSTIWAKQIQVSFPEFENPKAPRIQLINEKSTNQDLSIFNISTDTVSIFIQIGTIQPVFIKHWPHISHSTLFYRFFWISMTFDIFPQGVALIFLLTRWRSQAIPRL